ncbi:RNA polymerase, alpha subunit [Candidatus Desulfarcum epimagneticum]|uniref:DNA-directed RNA polymerase subunit alpha n=1 Tax=uncultured Desulfobacteraceae bacterium TaxID=218296 RepID=A0A484HHM6_9BACT|nr:RNA polymerase, alpha subunit [uncultured Desulfobacteraceae bacterium]
MSSNESMYINWQEMIKPEKVVVISKPDYGKFVCEPLERGFGITIGNSLRRIILSSLYGAAIVSVKFDHALHEFTSIEGVLEDVSEIILNLKEVRFSLDGVEPAVVRIEKTGKGFVTAADIVSEDGRCRPLNPDLRIATLSEGATLSLSMNVKMGRGYSLSEANKDEDAPIGTIPIDAVFSPIKRVNYVVSNARVGQKTDYDKLTMEVWTDGSVSPEDAVAYAAKIAKEQMTVFINFDEESEPEVEVEKDEPRKKEVNPNLYKSVEELELSVRSANCLKNANIFKIYQLVQKTEADMLKTKNFGRKSLNEIKQVLEEMDLHLGQKLDGFVFSDEQDLEQGE